VGLATVVALAALGVLVALAAGLAWRGSSLLLVPRAYALLPEFTVLGYRDGRVRLPAPTSPRPFADTRRAGSYALLWGGGHGRLGPVEIDDGRVVVRPLTILAGRPPGAGDAARLDTFVYRRDPLQDLGLPFQDVRVPSHVGLLAAWWLPGRGDAAVVIVHGRRRGERAETLRFLPAVIEGGSGALVLAYRNHRGAPPSPDGFYHYGASEFRDVLAGVRFLAERGVRRVALFGVSMGGTAVLEAAKHWPESGPALAGLLFDSPLVDPAAATVARLREAHLPLARLWAWLSLGVAAWRSGLRWRDLDQRRTAERLRLPVLLIAGTDDRTVPIGSVDAFARRLSGPVSYHRVAGADHVEAWNRDPGSYDAWLREFLAGLWRPAGS